MSISDREFSDLYETSRGAVDFILYRVEHDDALREDLVQEVFTAAWASRDSFAGAAQLKTWLMGVAKNIGRKYIRDEIINAPDLTYEHKFRSYEMDSEYEDDEYILQAHELQFGVDLSDPAAAVEFEQELERLSDSQQRAMELRLFGFTQEEIALDMGISQQMVSKLLTSARNQLMEGLMIQGIMKKVFTKPWTDKFKGTEITLYSFLLEGDDKFYGCGTAPVNASPGDSVEFTMKGKNVDMSTFKVVAKQEVAAGPIITPPATRNSGKTDWAKKEDYWSAKEARDIAKEERFRAVNEPRMALSVATEAAAQVVCAALAADVLGFGTAAKSKRLDMLTGYVKDVATDLANFITNAPDIVEYNDDSSQ